MKIGELFQREIGRKIEEVVKVDQTDEEVVKNEIEEYVATDSIKSHYIRVLGAYNQARTQPTEGIGVWISGFFGSGKSSFAKNLGYVIAAKELLGENAADIFSRQVQDDRIADLIKVINRSIPTDAVIFDISMERGVRTANERITAVMYKTLLRELGYAEDFDLAALEMDLEQSGELEKFIDLYNSEFPQFAPWETGRKRARAIGQASRILHLMDESIYPEADSWARGLAGGRADISANALAETAFELMDRRRQGRSLIFVIDEVGQYVSRSVDKMLDLQGVVQAFGVIGRNRVRAGKATAPTWIVVTSQEKLGEVVDALEGKKTEFARLKDRFLTQIDLAPEDISEVASRRVLQKKPRREETLEDLYDRNSGRLNTLCRLERTSRDSSVSRKAFVDLYPYLPHHIDLCIYIMSGIRLQPGAMRQMGGSNRTIIKQAQEMLINEKTNLAQADVGRLVTMDLVYDLVEGNLSTERRRDISDISRTFPDRPFYAKVAKTVCLLEFVRDLPRTPANIAALLFETMDSASVQPEVEAALEALGKAQFVRQTADGYKLQTAQEKNWEISRRGIEAKPFERNRIKREMAEDIFSDSRIRTYNYKSAKSVKTFRIGVTVNGDRVGNEGDISIFMIFADDQQDKANQDKSARQSSRENQNDIFWIVTLTEAIHDQIQELHRSKKMIEDHDRIAAQGKLPLEEQACLAEEKTRSDRIRRDLRQRMQKALQEGTIFFRGVDRNESTRGNDLPDILRSLLDLVIPDLYPNLDMGARPLSGDEAEKILTADNLNGLPMVFYEGEDGLSLVIDQGGKLVPNANAPIAKEIMDYISSQHSYSETVTGRSLESHFSGIGYGWERDVLRMTLATLFRGGAIEVSYQGRRFRVYSDPAARPPFVNNTAFRSSAFSPREAPSLRMLANAARNYENITGTEVDVEEGAISAAFQQLATAEREAVIPAEAKVSALQLPGSGFLREYGTYLEGILKSSPDDCVRMLANEGQAFAENREKARKIIQATSGNGLQTLRAAQIAVRQKIHAMKSANVDEGDWIQSGEDLEGFLDADTFYDRMADIARTEGIISRTYREEYERLHKERAEAYLSAINSLTGLPDWVSLQEDTQKQILAPLKPCGISEDMEFEELIFDMAGLTCEKCGSNLSQILYGIAAVQSLKSDAIEKFEKLAQPEKEIVKIRASRFFASSIGSEEELTAGLEQLREHIRKLLNEGKRVMLE